MCVGKQGFPGAQGQRIHLPSRRGRFDPLAWEDPLEKEMATHSGILAWEIPMDRWQILRADDKLESFRQILTQKTYVSFIGCCKK